MTMLFKKIPRINDKSIHPSYSKNNKKCKKCGERLNKLAPNYNYCNECNKVIKNG